MSKKRRTKREKLIASTRRVVTVSESGLYSFSTSSAEQPLKQTKDTEIIQHSYAYVTHDSQKTLFITGAILSFNVALSFLLQKHLIRLPFLGF